MITHKPKSQAPAIVQGVVAKPVRILSDVKAEVIADGKHLTRELKAGEVVVCPIWSARDLVARRKGEFA
jgi:hypothetical protein